MRRPALLLACLGAAVVALTWGAVVTTQGWPELLPRHLGLYVAAGVAWGIAWLALPRIPAGRGQLALVALVTVAIRLPAWWAPPAHSDDLYRFLWDGRVQRAGINPYRYAPDAPELASLRDESWQHINNRQLPTVYPPAAELLFAAATLLPLPSLAAWKAVVAALDLGQFALLLWWLGRRGGDRRRALGWGWSPLAAIELGQNGHMDVAGVLLLTAALMALERRRDAWAGALLGLSVAVKLVGLSLLPWFRGRRAFAAGAATVLLCTAPYLGAHGSLGGSLGEYGRRWRANDGAFALLHAAATAAVGHTRFRQRYTPESPRVARLVSGRDRDQIFPDEVANLAARAVAAALFLLAVALALRLRLAPLVAAELVLGAFLLLTPTLHPWYLLWMLPLIVLGDAQWAWVALAILVPLGYVPLGAWLAEGAWREPRWNRCLEHGVAWGALALGKAWPASKRAVLSGDS